MSLSELRAFRALPHLSASSIGDYIDCSMLYKWGRVDKLPREYIPSTLTFGTVIHLVLESYYRGKIGGYKMPLKDLHESFKKHWHERAKDRTDIQYTDGQDFDTMLNQGIDLLSVWHENLADDNFKVLSVEEPFSIDIENLDVPIIGVTDLIEEDESGTIIITDFKTSAKAYSMDQVNNNQQLTFYQMAVKRNGFADREILLKFDCLIKTKLAKFQSYWTTRNEIDELKLVKKIQQVWDGISKGVFIPNDTHWKHNNCPYRKACDEWFDNDGGE
jgi:putative RecB family exonuclease